jgi:hypothetical protein
MCALIVEREKGGDVSDLIRVDYGARGWLPAWDCQLVEVLHRQDRPLVGVVQQQGCLYLFDCMSGETDEASVWLYVHISSSEFEQLTSDRSPDSFRELLTQMEKGRGFRVAIAFERGGIGGQTSGADFPRDLDWDALKASFQEYLADLVRDGAVIEHMDAFAS